MPLQKPKQLTCDVAKLCKSLWQVMCSGGNILAYKISQSAVMLVIARSLFSKEYLPADSIVIGIIVQK